MSRTRIHELYDLGQSVWCDNLSRRMLDSGELNRLMDAGVAGVTSNPSIFMKSITSSTDYDRRMADLLAATDDVNAIYEGLVLPDIIDAADLLRPVYDKTGGEDGYVSLEVSPRLAYDTEGTVEEARRLWQAVNRPNVFIKVPATQEGLPAISTLIGEGINVNVTLIFGIEVYEQVIDAYITGLERLRASGGDVARVASVASFFVSRVDTLVDRMLEERAASGGASVQRLLGQAAIANAKIAYNRFEDVFLGSAEFEKLSMEFGARVQRPLWASTSTKNPSYPDTIYVDNLIGPDTVNTLPPATITAFLEHGKYDGPGLREGLDEAFAIVEQLESLGINLKSVAERLTTEGVKLFAQAFEELMDNIAAKQEQLKAVG